MDLPNDLLNTTRRRFLGSSGLAFGSMALGSLLREIRSGRLPPR